MMQVNIHAATRVTEDRLVLTGCFLFALLVRFVVIESTVGVHTPAALEPAADSPIHIALVQNLLAGRGFSLTAPTAITPPLYIWFLGGLYYLFGSPAAVRVVQAIMGASLCLLLYVIGRGMFGHAAGVVAAVILAVYPLVAYLTGLHLTENLFLLLLVCTIWQSYRVVEHPTPRAAIGLGILVGLAALTRAVFLAFLPLLFVWAVSQWGIRSSHTYRVTAFLLAGVTLTCLPWTIRNYAVLGEIVLIQSNGGMVFWSGNNPHSNGGMIWPTNTTWTESEPPNDGQYGWRDLGVAEENSRYVRAALTWIVSHPRDYARLLARKLLRLYGFARATDEQGLRVPGFVVFFQAGVYALAAIGTITAWPQWRMLTLPILLIIFTNVTTVLFSGATRYSVPMVPSLVLLSAFGALAAWKRLAPHRSFA